MGGVKYKEEGLVDVKIEATEWRTKTHTRRIRRDHISSIFPPLQFLSHSMPAATKHKRFGSEDVFDDVDDLPIPSTSRAGVQSNESEEESDDDAPPEAITMTAGKEGIMSHDKAVIEHKKEWVHPSSFYLLR